MTADGSDRSFGAPRFDVVLRGYDRRQVDEHLSRLQRLMGRMRGDLDTARSQLGPAPAGGRRRPTPRPRPDGSPPTGTNDVVGTFTDRMDAILQSAGRRPRRSGTGPAPPPGPTRSMPPACVPPSGPRRTPPAGRSRTSCAIATPCWPSSPGCAASWRACCRARRRGSRCRPRRAVRSAASWAPGSRCRAPRSCSSRRPRASRWRRDARRPRPGCFPMRPRSHPASRTTPRPITPRRRSRPSSPGLPSRRS